MKKDGVKFFQNAIALRNPELPLCRRTAFHDVASVKADRELIASHKAPLSLLDTVAVKK
jgi:hypothetical protein